MRFLIDIDGTVLTQQKPGEYDKCEPIPGAVEAVNRLFAEGHQVVFYTSRNFRYMQQTHEQLRAFGFNYHHLEFGKPHGDIIVDDRAIRFTSWAEAQEAFASLLSAGKSAVDRRSCDEEPPTASFAQSEASRLASLSRAHSYLADFNEKLSRYRIRCLRELGCAGESALELGCGEGLLTRYLADIFSSVEAVDASSTYIQRAKALVAGNVLFHESLIENFEPGRRFDWIVAGGLLEHVADPHSLLVRAATWLAPNGKLVAFVPNAVSLNRRLGKAMGLIADCYELTESDLKIGHRRVYNLSRLREELERAGLQNVTAGGMFLKPLSNAQMAAWDDGILDGLYKLGAGLPDLCTEIYAVGGACS